MADPDPDLDLGAKPIWRQRPVQIIAVVLVGVIAFVFTRPPPEPKPDADDKPSQSYIGVHSPYEPPPVRVASASPIALPAVLPVVTPPPPPAAIAAPPAPPFAMRDIMPPKPGAASTNVRPAMLSYVVPKSDAAAAPHSDPNAAQTALLFKPGVIEGAKASPAMDETLMLMPGLLPLVLDTAIDSTLPGPLLAHTYGPIYSKSGVQLMPAGTQVIGRYEQIGSTGQNRLMAVSTYAHTPEGIWVPLTGPMADDLGRSGLDGEVDRHLLSRFGGAILLSLTNSAISLLQASVQKNGNGNSYLNLNTGSGGPGSLAQDILRAQIDQPPTFSKHQGEMIALFLDHPVDFTSSYRLVHK